MFFASPDLIYNPPLEPYVSVVYRDDDILVLNKPSGLLSVPGHDPRLSDSLATRVRMEFPNAQMLNRLDKDTSGLVLISLNKKSHAAIAVQFENRTIKKLYTAVVWGRMPDSEGLIDLPLAIDPENKPRRRVDHDNGKSAQTQWHVVEFPSPDVTRVHLIPLTGRTHQLRVHMKSMGHPILGDSFYAGDDALAASPRLMLHSEKLGFYHPKGEDMIFTVPCPF